jgi:hypothetical protein
VPALGDKYVCRLDVAVNNSLRVRRVQCVRDFNSQVQHLLQRQRLAGNALLERLAVEKLHRNERLAVFLADIVNRADVWVVERGSSFCLTLKPFERLGVTH